MFSAYVSHAMTGRLASDCIKEAAHTLRIASSYKVKLYDPIIEEGVKNENFIVLNPMKTLKGYWNRDKELLRRAHVLIDYSGPAKSEGVAHEIGYARYFLWKPVIRVYENLGPSVARLEDDVIAHSLEQAFKIAVDRWGTWPKRFMWRLRIVPKGIVKHLWNQIVFLTQ